MNEEMKIIREVNNQAELFYQDAVILGNKAAQALGASETSSHRSQLTSLENIAESALKTSDVFDYIKKQTARSKESQGWRWAERRDSPCFGDELLTYLENKLKEKTDLICTRLEIGASTDAHAQKHRRIHLLLIRQFLRQMVVEYEYRVSLGARQRER